VSKDFEISILKAILPDLDFLESKLIKVTQI